MRSSAQQTSGSGATAAAAGVVDVKGKSAVASSRGKSTESGRLYKIVDGNSACQDVRKLLNEINANTIVDAHDSKEPTQQQADASSSSSSSGSSSDSHGHSRLMPLQRLQATYEQAVRSMQHIESSQHLRTGMLGQTNTGKSHVTNDLLVEHFLTDHYAKTDPASASTLMQQEKLEALRRFPARAAEERIAAVTLRPTVFVPTTGPVRVTREAHSKESLQTLLHMSNISNKADLLCALADLSDTHAMFERRELYVDKAFTNCWDAFRAASAAINDEEQAAKRESTSHPDLLYLSWSHIRYEGPWGNLHNKLDSADANIEWWDLPGLTDANEARRLMSFHCARQLHVVMLVTAARKQEPDDVNRLQSLFNRPHRQIPQVISVCNVGKVEPNDWLMHVQEHGGVAGYYEHGGEDSSGRTGVSMEKEMSDLLLTQQNAAEVCPALTGNHRLAVFETISESCRTILLYGRDKWRQLEQAGLLNDLRGKKAPPRAGNAALIQQLQHCQQRRIHRAVLDPLNLLHSLLQNAKYQLVQRGRLNRAKIDNTAAAQLIKQLSTLGFGRVLSWPQAVSQVPVSLDGSEEEWTDEVRLALLAQQQPDRNRLVIDLLSLTFGRAVADSQLSAHALHGLLKQLLRPLIRARVHHSCRSTFLALHLLMHSKRGELDRHTVDAEEEKQASQIADQLAIYEESDAAHADNADGEDEKDKQELQSALQGRGHIPADLKARLYDDLCRAAFVDSSRMAEEQLNDVCAEQWLGDFLRSTLTAMLRSRQSRIIKAASRSPVEVAVGAVKREMLSLIHDTLLELERHKLPKKQHAHSYESREALLSGDVWDGQYQRVLTGATAEMVKDERDKHRNVIKRLLKKWVIPSSLAAPITNAQQHAFLSVAPVLLEGKAQVVSSAVAQSDVVELDILQPVPLDPVGKISGIVLGPNALQLPKRLPGDHPALFTVTPVSIQFIGTGSGSNEDRSADGAADSQLRLGSGSMRGVFERHPLLRNHPKRMLLEFKDNNPGEQEMALFAYDGLLSDLESCLRSTQGSTGNKTGLAPVFVSTKARWGGGSKKRRTEQAKARIDFSGDMALDLDNNPHTLVFVLVEREEAVPYFEAFSPAAGQPLRNVVFVIIPGANRGIRFARSCMVYLASCMRQALIDHKSDCPRLDVFHSLDDDWRGPRVFDPALIGEQCMRPCSLHMALFYAEKVLRAELAKNDGRDELLCSQTSEEWLAFLTLAAKQAKTDPFNLRFTLREKYKDIKHKADQDALHDSLAPYAIAMPGFKERFLMEMQQAKGQGQKVAQVGMTQKNITALINHNCMKIGKDAQGQLVYPHYKISADRRGCCTHFLPIYDRERVNYLNDADFFLSQPQIATRLQKADQYSEWFRNDRHFIREVLEPRGIGGMVLFKFDIDFARVRLGGLMSIPIKGRADNTQQHKHAHEAPGSDSRRKSDDDHSDSEGGPSSGSEGERDSKSKGGASQASKGQQAGRKQKRMDVAMKQEISPTKKRQRAAEQQSEEKKAKRKTK